MLHKSAQIIASSDEVVAQKYHGNCAMARLKPDALTGCRIIRTVDFDKCHTFMLEDPLGSQAVPTQWAGIDGDDDVVLGAHVVETIGR